MKFFKDLKNLNKALFEYYNFVQIISVIEASKIKIDNNEIDDNIKDLLFKDKDYAELSNIFKYARNNCRSEITNIDRYIISLLSNADDRNKFGGFILRIISSLLLDRILLLEKIRNCKLFKAAYSKRLKGKAYYYIMACQPNILDE